MRAGAGVHNTVDADILIVPERDSLYRALPRLKEELQINVEIASPAHFSSSSPRGSVRSRPRAASESLNRLNEIVLGKRGISADTALRPGHLLETSPQFWMRLQADWDLHRR